MLGASHLFPRRTFGFTWPRLVSVILRCYGIGVFVRGCTVHKRYGRAAARECVYPLRARVLNCATCVAGGCGQ
jgi:hypothetical protein